jgi:hypothetical protein
MEEDEINGACSTHGEMKEYNILFGKSVGKRPLGRHRSDVGVILQFVLR